MVKKLWLPIDLFYQKYQLNKVGKLINLIINESVSPSLKTLINLQEALDNDTHWAKLSYIYYVGYARYYRFYNKYY